MLIGILVHANKKLYGLHKYISDVIRCKSAFSFEMIQMLCLIEGALGHSSGKVVAAYCCGAPSLESAMRFAYQR